MYIVNCIITNNCRKCNFIFGSSAKKFFPIDLRGIKWSQSTMETFWAAAPRCFIFMYFLLPYWVPATWWSRVQTSIWAEFPSGKLPTTGCSRGSPDSDIQWRCWYKYASSVHWESHSRSEFPQCLFNRRQYRMDYHKFMKIIYIFHTPLP